MMIYSKGIRCVFARITLLLLFYSKIAIVTSQMLIQYNPYGDMVLGDLSSNRFSNDIPTGKPSISPSHEPSASLAPSDAPTDNPTTMPTLNPTKFPTNEPSSQPSALPSVGPSIMPSINPTAAPTEHPTTDPTNIPTLEPSPLPSELPSTFPTTLPTQSPSTSSLPSKNPTSMPSTIPSSHPSEFPTTDPTVIPSDLPSLSSYPSINPTVTTATPSKYPTSEPTSEPSNVRRSGSYWNYNDNTRFGPKSWKNVKGDPIFKEMTGSSSNRCSSSDGQSPIDLVVATDCKDDHQIQIDRGEYNFNEVDFQLLPHALRVVFPKTTKEKRAPRADFSNLSDWVDARYLDVKLPSEHRVNGKQYPGEIHIAHDWGSKMIMVGWFLDFSQNKHDPQFEEFILRWEDKFYERDHDCFYRGAMYPPEYKKKYTFKPKKDMWKIFGSPFGFPGSADFDVYRLQPTVYYYGYVGSVTVPPCTKDVVWRFLDLPMQISRQQYLRLQKLILDQRDDDCKRSTKAYHGQINRPLQKNNHRVWHCNGRKWRPRFEFLFCDKWPKSYHASFHLKKKCDGV